MQQAESKDTTKREFFPLLKVWSDQIRPNVIVCGDPARAAAIAERLSAFEELSYNREFRLFDGELNGTPLTVVSHGVGAAGAAVCFSELIRGGARQIIRVGTAGSLAPSRLRDGDLVVAGSAVRCDGVTQQLVAMPFPAVADIGLTMRLNAAVQDIIQDDGSRKPGEGRAECGMVLTIGAFYTELEPLPNNYYSQAGVIAVEMEAAALFVLCSMHGVAASAVLALDGVAVDFDADAYDPHRDVVGRAVEVGIEAALRVYSDATPRS